MTPLQLQLIGHVLGALVNALVVAFVKDTAVQVAAIGLWASIAAALHIPRPQDSSPAQVQETASLAAELAGATHPAEIARAAADHTPPKGE